MSKHKHQFTIPVEWEYNGEIANADFARATQYYRPLTKKVTKLRCICGEETRR